MDTTQIKALIMCYKMRVKNRLDSNKHTLYSITHYSTSLEGSTLSKSEVIDLLEYRKPAVDKPVEHHLMVIDYFNVLKFVIEQAKEKQTISATLIQKIAAFGLENTGSEVNTIADNYDTWNGNLRKGKVRAGSSIFPNFNKVDYLIFALCEIVDYEILKINTIEEKCNLAFWLHFELVCIQPFGDRNGRTSRLLMNYIQAYFDLPLSVFYKSDRIKYLKAIETARNTDDMSNFYQFMYQQYARFLREELKELKK